MNNICCCFIEILLTAVATALSLRGKKSVISWVFFFQHSRSMISVLGATMPGVVLSLSIPSTIGESTYA